MIWPTPYLWWIIAYYVSFTLLVWLAGRWVNSIRLQRQHRRVQSTNTSVEDTQPLDAFILLYADSSRSIVSSLLGATVLFGAVMFIGYQKGRSPDAMISILDVGQGDSILIRTATGRHLLVDGGGTISFRKFADRWRDRKIPFEIGEKVVVPLLKQRGVRNLDAVVLTHADQDHAGGLQAVLEHIPTKRLMMNGTWKSSPSLQLLYQTALQQNIPIMKGKQGDSWAIDAWTHMKVLYPAVSSARKHVPLLNEQNEASLVLHLTFTHPHSKEQLSMLLTGDVGAEGERMMLMDPNMYTCMPVDVMKVAHHGSKTSTTPEWLQAWQPRLAVISAGRNNRYGHPHPLVLKMLSLAKVQVLRTDQAGEVQVTLTSNGWKVRKKQDSVFP